MVPLQQASVPRKSVFEKYHSDDVLDLTRLVSGQIDYNTFFDENFQTEGMKLLIETAFQRFSGISTNGLVKLTQAMGGGKTHNMISLGLLAKYPEVREKIIPRYSNIGDIKVVAFTGRESDAPLGIWGAIAEQLGKKDYFKDYYSPLAAPGQTAWINLLQDQSALILLDEIPPYLENAKSISIGNSDLSVVTVTALSNLFNALNDPRLSRVFVVVADLKSSWQGGSQLLSTMIKNLDNEMGRTAKPIEPVQSTTDEVYEILKVRLFKELPSKEVIEEIAKEYRNSVEEAKQMQLTSMSPEKIYSGIKDSYPFHPSIKELYERFKENEGFQQTRGLIRLMRSVVRQVYENGKSTKNLLINAYDFDLSDNEMHTMISQVNQSLSNAISHDIYNEGRAVAEIVDSQNKDSNIQDLSKLLLISSLANIPNALLGLSVSELLGYLAQPGRDISEIKKSVEKLTSEAWYIHNDKDGRFYFKNVRNLIAELNSYVDSYDNEAAKKELRMYLNDKFQPIVKDCYQKVLIFPAVDEIELDSDKNTLILFEPYISNIHPDLNKLFEDTPYKNRLLLLSGQRNTMDSLLRVAKEYKAINVIIAKMKEERVPENNPQFEMAVDREHKINISLLSAARETFVTLYYPVQNDERPMLISSDFMMEFSDNKYNGEDQIKSLLKQKQKFTDETGSEGFRKKCEARLFTQKQMRWSDIVYRAATNPQWQWHHPRALEILKEQMLKQDIWREEAGYLDKGPFPKESTDVLINEGPRNPETGEVTLRITPKFGDKVYYEINGTPTTGSLRVEDFNSFKTTEIHLSFLCIDSTHEHVTGEPRTWTNTIVLRRSDFYDQADGRYIEFFASPEASIRYTTDGSDPKEYGGLYEEKIKIPENAKYIIAIAEKEGVYSNKLQVEVGEDPGVVIDKDKSLELTRRKRMRANNTSETYRLLESLKKHSCELRQMSLNLNLNFNSSSNPEWILITSDPTMFITPVQVEKIIDNMRTNFSNTDSIDLTLECTTVKFASGQGFEDWIAENKLNKKEFKQDEINQ